MARHKRREATARPGAAGPARTRSAPGPLLTRAEIQRAVVELAHTLAPADVVDVLTRDAGLIARAAKMSGAAGERLRAQLALALACLRDHVAGACPQIPFRCISLLAAGVAYMDTTFDLIPDFLPRSGTIDDAMVMALACELAADGLGRYCRAKGIPFDANLMARRVARAPRARSHA